MCTTGVCFERESKKVHGENAEKDAKNGAELGVVEDLRIQRPLVLIMLPGGIGILCVMLWFGGNREWGMRVGG